MFYIKTQYLRLNRILLLAVGLWPYEQSKLVRLQLVLFLVIMATFIVFQFTLLAILKHNYPQIIIEVLSTAFFFIVCMIKYNSYCCNINAIKHLLDLLQCTHDKLRDDSEVAIIEKYWNLARRYTVVLTFLGTCGLSVLIFISLLPLISDIELFANESQSCRVSLLIIRDYFIEKENYFVLIILHANVANFIAVIALLATGTMTIMYLLHACGMFRVASYRIQQAMTSTNLQISSTKQNENLIYIGIIRAIDMHRKAIRFVTLLMSALNIYYFFLIMALVISASLNLFRIFENISFRFDIYEAIISSLFLIILFMYMFLANKLAQQIMDHNNHIFTTVYNVEWHIAPLRIQKLILFLLQKGTKSFNIVIGGLFIASLEGFAKLTSTSISYFTVIYSVK
ncbi:hypothetical protein HN011_008110 [Eciton burchellii]|nr:hypothetical protein HN011_008110 [Eciton burchellii]